MRLIARLTFAAAAFALCAAAAAQKPSAYPGKGQSAQQQAKDDEQCLAWAKQSTGIDPAAVANAQPAPTGPQGERLRGAARGAVVGEIVADDAGAGAAVGALAGGRRARVNQAARAQQADASKAQAMDTYYRAYGACMQGRGYSVK
ncbi:hypothetical protein M2650_13305 [Luteimonas sp. SX5]|uniref:YMGG-like Gly-zipper domain-containing protein n=1 Tax=Luteimonas galliterrae TaxID=2940486 RepID=A0ABT0MMX6_9GAMM|nr:hypothetical protein [Luteimonas galliterrae]MCL1635599.1 hypothetical protein [Luteimonas galliterrae]